MLQKLKKQKLKKDICNFGWSDIVLPLRIHRKHQRIYSCSNNRRLGRDCKLNKQKLDFVDIMPFLGFLNRVGLIQQYIDTKSCCLLLYKHSNRPYPYIKINFAALCWSASCLVSNERKKKFKRGKSSFF